MVTAAKPGAAPDYKANVFRSTFAIPLDCSEGLQKFVSASGAPSLSGLLTMAARDPEKFAEPLKELIAQTIAESPMVSKMRMRHKVTKKQIAEEMSKIDLSREEFEELMEQLKRKKEGNSQ